MGYTVGVRYSHLYVVETISYGSILNDITWMDNIYIHSINFLTMDEPTFILPALVGGISTKTLFASSLTVLFKHMRVKSFAISVGDWLMPTERLIKSTDTVSVRQFNSCSNNSSQFKLQRLLILLCLLERVLLNHLIFLPEQTQFYV